LDHDDCIWIDFAALFKYFSFAIPLPIMLSDYMELVAGPFSDFLG
jgi:hypothetical protein